MVCAEVCSRIEVVMVSRPASWGIRGVSRLQFVGIAWTDIVFQGLFGFGNLEGTMRTSYTIWRPVVF